MKMQLIFCTIKFINKKNITEGSLSYLASSIPFSRLSFYSFNFSNFSSISFNLYTNVEWVLEGRLQ